MPLSNTIRIAPGGEHLYLIGPKRFNMRQLEGEQSFVQDNDFSALMTASPAKSPKLRMAIVNIADAAQVASQYSIHIVYHTLLYDRKIPVQSLG